MIATSVAPLFVTDSGDGPPVVLFQSLFVDQRSWDEVVAALSPGRRLIRIDAPNHGRSGKADRDFTIADVAGAAGEVLDALGVSEPVDWVGNALGGHVGITFTGTQPERVRTLVTIGTPVEPFTTRELWSQIIPLVQGYRVLGPKPFVGILKKTLLGPEAIAANPEFADRTMDAFASADRRAMYQAMTCYMRRRESVAKYLPAISIPTLMLVAEGGQEGWTPDDAAKASRPCRTGHRARFLDSGVWLCWSRTRSRWPRSSRTSGPAPLSGVRPGRRVHPGRGTPALRGHRSSARRTAVRHRRLSPR